jgi:dihydroorotate dehydrogenase
LRDLQNSESLPELLQRVVSTRNAQERKVPVFLKVAPDLKDEDIKSICRTVLQKDTRVDGLIISNTTISRDGLSSELKDQAGGLSGKPLEKASTALVGKFYKEMKGQIPIIGVGGVWSGEDAYNKICAGATAVQMYTALVYNGPGIVSRIKNELSELLKENGFESVQQAVGSSHRKTNA